MSLSGLHRIADQQNRRRQPGGFLHLRFLQPASYAPKSPQLTVTTTWSYDPTTKRLSGKVYTPASADMPAEGFVYDRLGRLKKMTSGSATAKSWEYAYDAATLLPATETMSLDTDSNGTADTTYVLYRYYDALRRPCIVDLIVPGGSPFYRSTLAYETTAGRLLSVNSGGDTFTYGYKIDAPGLVQTVTGGGVTVTNAWEANRDVLDWKENKFGSTVISKYDYTVNSMGRRTNLTETGTAYSGSPTVGWDYNSRGELTLHNHSNNFWDSACEFDSIGNRRKAYGSTVLGADNHTVNSLNQYTSIGGVSPSYDFAGNLIADAGGNTHSSPRTYTWDGENRLVKVTTVSGGATLATYRYDPLGRRYGRTTGGVSTWFLYDGWNMLSEIINGGQERAHVWGLDLSGTPQGAGGVGGLLSSYTSSEKYRPLYDGNGNIVQYVTSTGSMAASYEYSPFGHLLSSSGPVAPYLNFGFSTKVRDLETGLHYYGHRYYSSWMGRWISRDPIGERGGLNLYGMVNNNPIKRIDFLGLNPQLNPEKYPNRPSALLLTPEDPAGPPANHPIIHNAKEMLDRFIKDNKGKCSKCIGEMDFDAHGSSTGILTRNRDRAQLGNEKTTGNDAGEYTKMTRINAGVMSKYIADRLKQADMPFCGNCVIWISACNSASFASNSDPYGTDDATVGYAIAAGTGCSVRFSKGFCKTNVFFPEQSGISRNNDAGTSTPADGSVDYDGTGNDFSVGWDVCPPF